MKRACKRQEMVKVGEVEKYKLNRSIATNTYGHTHTHTQNGSQDFVHDNLGELVPEEIFTHSHLSWSSIIPHLPLHLSSITIHGIPPVQFTCPTVLFHNLSPSPPSLPLGMAPHPHPIYLFTQPLSSPHTHAHTTTTRSPQLRDHAIQA